MITIKFPPKYEDRISIFLRTTNLKELGITWDFKEEPCGEDAFLAYWLFNYHNRKHVNVILRKLLELKDIMGVEELEFQYVNSEKEFFTQSTEEYRSIPWFKV